MFEGDSQLEHFVDPFDAAKDKEIREKWLEKMKNLFGEFKPCQQNRNLEKVSRSHLPDIVLHLRKILVTDWAETKLIIGCNV